MGEQQRRHVGGSEAQLELRPHTQPHAAPALADALHLDLSSLPPRGSTPAGSTPSLGQVLHAASADSPSPAAVSAAAAAPLLLRSLGLDSASLAARHMPEALVGALHRSLAASASAFFRTCLAERRKLAALLAGGEAVPLADRVLAFITGTEGELQVRGFVFARGGLGGEDTRALQCMPVSVLG